MPHQDPHWHSRLIQIRGAKVHNLKNIDLDIPHNQLVVFSGVSGSGKSSLAFDTLAKEGQRRYIESISTYARSFLPWAEKPDVDLIEGLSPTISICPQTTPYGARSSVGSLTGIYDYLRLLFAKLGSAVCPIHQEMLHSYTPQAIAQQILALPEQTRVMLIAPLGQFSTPALLTRLDQIKAQGFLRVRIDGILQNIEDVLPPSNSTQQHQMEIVVDRFKVRPELQQRITEAIELCLQVSPTASITVFNMETDQSQPFSTQLACPQCGWTCPAVEAKWFSSNVAESCCTHCGGQGRLKEIDPDAVVCAPEKSLHEGALRGWDSQNPFYAALITALSEYTGSDLQNTPFSQLSTAAQSIIMYGTKETPLPLSYPGSNHEIIQINEPFPGIIPTLEAQCEREGSTVAPPKHLAALFKETTCPHCQGSGLHARAQAVHIHSKSFYEVSQIPLLRLSEFLQQCTWQPQQAGIARRLIDAMCLRLSFLNHIGLSYLSLHRQANTLSGGEVSRVRLAAQLGAHLSGVTYILDEPSTGLHPSDTHHLIHALRMLQQQGNSVLVVEHDAEIIQSADHIIELGPGAGRLGGQIIAQGDLASLLKNPDSVTAPYLLDGRINLPCPPSEKTPKNYIHIEQAYGNNLKNISVSIPLGVTCCITGVSGSGKTTLVRDILCRAVHQFLFNPQHTAIPAKDISGLEQVQRLIHLDQSPISKSSRSTPATYSGVFTHIRSLFSQTPTAKERGYQSRAFSFNATEGRCPVCKGDGDVCVEMHLMASFSTPCQSCLGTRYKREILQILYKGKSIHDVLSMTVSEAKVFFQAVPNIHRSLYTLERIGLGYLKLGQSANSLSGGEAQRLKLSQLLAKQSQNHTLYVLDEPTTGLHFSDIKILLPLLHELNQQGHSILIIEHAPYIIQNSDWIIELGPNGGEHGGELIFSGTVRDLLKCPNSKTAPTLRQHT